MSKQKKQPPREAARAPDPKAITDDVASLINERGRIEEWIATLEAKREQTPAHVFTRVRGDYETRLRGVVEKLASHTSSLGNELAGLKKRLEKIDNDIHQEQDERAEIEIRAQVGELDSSEVADALRTADEGLARLAASRKAIEADLVRVTEFFAAAGGGPAPSPAPVPSTQQSRTSFDELSFLKSVVGENEAKPGENRPRTSLEIEQEYERPGRAAPSKAATPTQTPTPTPAPAPATSVEPLVATTGERAAEKPAEKGVEAKAVEKPVEAKAAEPKTAEKPVEAKTAEPTAAEKPVAAPAELGIEKESEPFAARPPQRPMRPSIAAQQASMTIEPSDVPRANPGIVKADESAPSLLDGIASKVQADEKPFAANVASNNPLSLKSSAKGDVKTLKCRECGAMNDPTEWYCERCGAELSAM